MNIHLKILLKNIKFALVVTLISFVTQNNRIILKESNTNVGSKIFTIVTITINFSNKENNKEKLYPWSFKKLLKDLSLLFSFANHHSQRNCHISNLWDSISEKIAGIRGLINDNTFRISRLLKQQIGNDTSIKVNRRKLINNWSCYLLLFSLEFST